MASNLTLSETTRAKGVDVPERITRAILAARVQWDKEHPDRPNSFTLGRAIEAARAQWRLEPQFKGKVNGRDPLFDAIVSACGGSLTELTRQYSAQVATAKRDILEASPNVTPDEIIRRASRYRAKYREATLSPSALAKHWPEFPMANGGPKKPDVYREPVGWHDALKAMAARNRWDGAVVQAMLSAGWLELSTSMREDILKEIK